MANRSKSSLRVEATSCFARAFSMAARRSRCLAAASNSSASEAASISNLIRSPIDSLLPVRNAARPSTYPWYFS